MTGTHTRAPQWGDFDFDERLEAMPKAAARALLDAEFEKNDIAERMGRRPMMVDDYNARWRKILDRPDPEKSAPVVAPPHAPARKSGHPDSWISDKPFIPDPAAENAAAHRKTFAEKISEQWKAVGKETLINQLRMLSNGAQGINRILLSLHLISFRRAVADELEDLRKRVAELEARPQMKYCGVFQDDRAYSPGEFVTCNGSIWYCRSAVSGGRPGASASWQLAVKHGRDGRDGRADA